MRRCGRTATLEIELELGDGPVRGVVQMESRRGETFSGWLELMAYIDRARAGAPRGQRARRPTPRASRITSALALVALAALVGVSPAAAQGRGSAPDSFDGTCTIQGTASLENPVKLELAPNGSSFRGTGTCTGNLNGQEVVDTPIRAKGSTHGDLACFNTVATGRGRLVFTRGTQKRGDDRVLSVLIDQTPHPLTMRIAGAEGGYGLASFLFTGSDRPLAACLAEGITEVTYQGVIRTALALRG
jgi:hypothetical protein